jgi:hypothetical protein
LERLNIIPPSARAPTADWNENATTMPFRHLWRQLNSYQDPQLQQYDHHRPKSQLTIVDTDYLDNMAWHEMELDYTTRPPRLTPFLGGQQPDVKLHAQTFATTVQSSPTQTHSSGHLLGADTSRISSSPYQRVPRRRRAPVQRYTDSTYTIHSLSTSGSSMPSLNSASSFDSLFINSEADLMAEPPVPLAGLPMGATSRPGTKEPFDATTSTKTDMPERMCPFIAGDIDRCDPSRCGPDAPCMDFTTIPVIEDCAPTVQFPTARSLDDAASADLTCQTESRSDMRGSVSTSTRSWTSLSSASTPSTKVVVKGGTPSQRFRPSRTTSQSTRAVKDATIDTSTKADPPLSKSDAKQRAKQAHSLVEKKYRENLNAQISLLHTTLVNSRYGPRFIGSDATNETDGHPNTNINANPKKSDVLGEALDYVNHTEVEMRHMEAEILRLTERVQMLEKLVRCDDCDLTQGLVDLRVRGSMDLRLPSSQDSHSVTLPRLYPTS